MGFQLHSSSYAAPSVRVPRLGLVGPERSETIPATVRWVLKKCNIYLNI
jgi:hypothetical protein